MFSCTTYDTQGEPTGRVLNGEAALAALAAWGVDAGRVETPAAVVSAAPMLTHARTLLALQRRYDTVMTDHVRQRPWPGRRAFPPPAPAGAPGWPEPVHEHTHDDRELRVVLQGALRVLLRLPQGSAAVLFEAGCWFALHAGLPHLAQAPADTGVELLRLYARPRGWVPRPTGTALPQPPLLRPLLLHPPALAA